MTDLLLKLTDPDGETFYARPDAIEYIGDGYDSTTLQIAGQEWSCMETVEQVHQAVSSHHIVVADIETEDDDA